MLRVPSSSAVRAPDSGAPPGGDHADQRELGGAGEHQQGQRAGLQRRRARRRPRRRRTRRRRRRWRRRRARPSRTIAGAVGAGEPAGGPRRRRGRRSRPDPRARRAQRAVAGPGCGGPSWWCSSSATTTAPRAAPRPAPARGEQRDRGDGGQPDAETDAGDDAPAGRRPSGAERGADPARVLLMRSPRAGPLLDPRAAATRAPAGCHWCPLGRAAKPGSPGQARAVSPCEVGVQPDLLDPDRAVAVQVELAVRAVRAPSRPRSGTRGVRRPRCSARPRAVSNRSARSVSAQAWTSREPWPCRVWSGSTVSSETSPSATGSTSGSAAGPVTAKPRTVLRSSATSTRLRASAGLPSEVAPGVGELVGVERAEHLGGQQVGVLPAPGADLDGGDRRRRRRPSRPARRRRRSGPLPAWSWLVMRPSSQAARVPDPT